MYARPFPLLAFLFSAEARPASVQTMKHDTSNFFSIISSSGSIVVVSAVFPGLMQNERGSPSLSMNSPSCTMGLGRCSFERPYLRNPSASSISKK